MHDEHRSVVAHEILVEFPSTACAVAQVVEFIIAFTGRAVHRLSHGVERERIAIAIRLARAVGALAVVGHELSVGGTADDESVVGTERIVETSLGRRGDGYLINSAAAVLGHDIPHATRDRSADEDKLSVVGRLNGCPEQSRVVDARVIGKIAEDVAGERRVVAARSKQRHNAGSENSPNLSHVSK